MSENTEQTVAGVRLEESCIRRFAPVVEAIRTLSEKKGQEEPVLVAIDGRCASGKSTMGAYLQNLFDANLFHMDDFFLQKQQRTEKRFAEVGGNVDYERFFSDVLLPLKEGKTVEYRPFDCSSMELGAGKQIKPKRINLVEGSYSQHPYFGEVYDLTVFSDIDTESQLSNIERRNGSKMLEVFRERWIPKEEAYFKQFAIRAKSDVIVEWIKK